MGSSKQNNKFKILIRGTKYAIRRKDGSFLWDRVDRQTKVRIISKGKLLTRARIMNSLSGPIGPLDRGDLIYVETRHLLEEDDTQPIDLQLEMNAEAWNEIIISIQEQMYDMRHDQRYYWDKKFMEQYKRLEKNLLEAKEEYDKATEKGG